MYVFVEIRFDPSHLVATIQRNFSTDQRLVLMGTIQFTGSVYGRVCMYMCKCECISTIVSLSVFVSICLNMFTTVINHLSIHPLYCLGMLGTVQQQLTEHGYLSLSTPQAKPLSGGETLGCTSPLLPSDCQG